MFVANFDNKIGAVGFLPRFAYKAYPAAIVKVDEKTRELIRDPKTGLAIRCEFNEPGELVGRIEKDHPARDFGGYLTMWHILHFFYTFSIIDKHNYNTLDTQVEMGPIMRKKLPAMCLYKEILFFEQVFEWIQNSYTVEGIWKKY